MDKLHATSRELNLPAGSFTRTVEASKLARRAAQVAANSLLLDMEGLSDVLTEKEAKELSQLAEAVLLDSIVKALID